MQRTNIYLEARQTATLDRLAAAEGVSRAEIIRRIIDRSLAERDGSIDADRAAIDLSFGVLAQVEIDAPLRGGDVRADHLAELWGARG